MMAKFHRQNVAGKLIRQRLQALQILLSVMEFLRILAQESQQFVLLLEGVNRRANAGGLAQIMLVAQRAMQFDDELKTLGRPLSQAEQAGLLRRPVKSVVQLHYGKMPPVMREHPLRGSSGRIKSADPIRIGIAASADPQLHALFFAGGKNRARARPLNILDFFINDGWRSRRGRIHFPNGRVQAGSSSRVAGFRFISSRGVFSEGDFTCD